MGLKKSLRDAAPFDQLPEEVFEKIVQAATLKKFPPHAYLFKQHAQPTGFLYVIKEGTVEITAQVPGGPEVVVDFRHPGEFFGGTPVFTGEPYTGGARTVKVSECYLIPAEVLRQIEKDFPQLGDFFTRFVLSRVKNLYTDILEEHSKNALTKVDAFPFQKRLSEVMSAPVEVCGPETPAQQVARQMSDKEISSVLVLDDYDALIGIITEKDLINKVLAVENVDFKNLTAGEIMTENPHFMAPEDYMYEAMSYMLGHRIKHLAVVDRDEPVGMITMRDLMRFRCQRAMLLVGNVKEAQTVDELAAINAQIAKVAETLLGETRSHFETMEIISYIHHRIQQRCFDLVFEQMRQEGHMPPDVRFCMMIMGSGGRKEMLLGPDQDNGFIFEDFPDEKQEEVDAFFIPFADRLVASLERCGYPRCHGEVMITNSYWRGRLKEWQERVFDWINVPEPKKVMYSTIFFDFIPLVGDGALCQDLRNIVYSHIQKSPLFLYHLMENDRLHKPALSLLGRFIVEKSGQHKGKVSLKQSGSVFLVDCVRIFALEKGIDATPTIERLEQLVQMKVLTRETGDHIKAALEAFAFIRLRHEIALVEQGEQPVPYLDPNALSQDEQDLLKEAFRAAAKLQDSTKRHFSTLVG